MHSDLKINSSYKQIKGKQAEEEACHYLRAHGLQLLSQNYRCKLGEIDLVMQDQDAIVFIEVRSRSQNFYGTPIESINRRKQCHLIRAATHYLQIKQWLHKVNCRFDVVTINENVQEKKLQWFKNAFSVEIK